MKKKKKKIRLDSVEGLIVNKKLLLKNSPRMQHKCIQIKNLK